MSKESGLGDHLYVDSYDLSGDVGSVSAIGAPFGVLPITGIDKYAPERVAAHLDGVITFQSWFNPDSGQAHDKLSGLPRTDVIGSYFHGGAIGNVAASLVAKQVGYDGQRGADGSLTMATSLTANGWGLEWGLQGTAGQRTDTAATNGSSLDGGAATALGLQAYLHVFSLTGTDCTVAVEDSANNSTWAALADGAFAEATGGTSERIATAADATVRRYLRVVTTGTFTECVFAVNLVRNASALA